MSFRNACLNTLLLYGCALSWAGSAHAETSLADTTKGLDKIQHIIVITLENHSFDNLFGSFPGAEGLAESHDTSTQRDASGKAYPTLPTVMETGNYPPTIDKRFPADLANKPFLIDTYVPASEKTPDLVHRFYEEQDQIHGGSMDRFALISDAGALTMGYYNIHDKGLWKYASNYTLADHFFHAAFGGSFLNHFWLVCACTPRFDNAPEELVTRLDDTGKMIKGGSVTADGYAVNTLFSVYMPHPAEIKDTSKLLPPQEMPTIGDRLSEKNIDWAWYAGGWDEALSGHTPRSYQFHHQPFMYFKAYADGTDAKKAHLKDEKDFLNALKENTLPPVAFYKPLGEFNMHPGYADVDSGDRKFIEIMEAIEHSPVWQSSVVIVTFDENGGYWDHVPPPKGDRWGPGVRVPTLIISPFARRHAIDHTAYDTTAILRLIETRFNLEPLGARDAAAADLLKTLVLN